MGKSEDQGQAELHKFMSKKLPKYDESQKRKTIPTKDL